jgi:hypothetical protein
MRFKQTVFSLSDYIDERYHPRSYQLFLALIFLGLVLFGLTSTVPTEQAQIFGYLIPPLCPFKRITTLDCPGCGLTRAFIMALHGQFLESYRFHLWGIPVTLLVLFQIPYRLWRAISSNPSTFKLSSASIKWLRTSAALAVFVPWAVKTAFTLSGILR